MQKKKKKGRQGKKTVLLSVQMHAGRAGLVDSLLASHAIMPYASHAVYLDSLIDESP